MKTAAGEWIALSADNCPPYDTYVLLKLKEDPNRLNKYLPVNDSIVQMAKLVPYMDGFNRPYPARFMANVYAGSQPTISISDVEAWAPIHP